MTTLPSNIPFKISNSDPLTAVRDAGTIVIGQLGQTLDGCIATQSGDSKYINGEDGLSHLHGLRSIVDAVIVGVGSVNADNPKLTVRLCDGKHPRRVVIDPNGRVDPRSCMFMDGCPDTMIVTSTKVRHPLAGRFDIISLPACEGLIRPADIVDALRNHGMQKILVEGGNRTLSLFMDDHMLDRLHLIVAPVIMGSGLPGLQTEPISRLDQATRPEVTLYPLGQDILFDCRFQPGGTARKST